MKKIRIAIDGPAGAGKSTISKFIAKKLDMIYLDTGAMYRTVALSALESDIDPKNEELLIPMLEKINVNIKYVKGEMRIFLGNMDVTDKIRTKEVSLAASDVAVHASVRTKMVDIQRDLAAKNSLVMDGRDIGSYVLKDADIKIFLTATVEDRAERRYLELKEKGQDPILEEIEADIAYRDKNDSSRKVAPLLKAEDAILFDTTGNTLNESKELLLEYINEEISIIKYKTSRFIIEKLSKSLINLLYRIKVEGLENVPKDGSLIVCANHTSFADIPLLECYIPRLITFATKKELFKTPFISFIVKTFDSISVDRSARDVSAAKELYKRLKRGRCVGIFPEGSRTVHVKAGKAKYRIRSGAVKLAYETNSAILPVSIKSNFKFLSKITMVVGKPIKIEIPDKKEATNFRFKQESKILMDHIYGLNGRKNEYIES